MLLLLGGCDLPTGVPTVEVPYVQIEKVMRMVQFSVEVFPIFPFTHA